MTHGVRIGVDVGSVRIGVAASDADGTLSLPVTTVRRDERGASDLAQIARLVADRAAVEVVVGLPRTRAGREGKAAAAAREFADALAARIAPVPVVLVDERLTTVSAARSLRAAGRSSKQQRDVVDQVAAAELLQSFLDATRAGSSSGERIS